MGSRTFSTSIINLLSSSDISLTAGTMAEDAYSVTLPKGVYIIQFGIQYRNTPPTTGVHIFTFMSPNATDYTASRYQDNLTINKNGTSWGAVQYSVMVVATSDNFVCRFAFLTDVTGTYRLSPSVCKIA